LYPSTLLLTVAFQNKYENKAAAIEGYTDQRLLIRLMTK
jgi:hypothetical protein